MESSSSVDALVEKHGAAKVFQMFADRRKSFTIDEIPGVVRAVTQISAGLDYSTTGGFVISMNSQRSQAARFCVELIDSNIDRKESLNLYNELCAPPNDHYFAYEVHAWLRNAQKELKHELDEKELMALAQIILENMKSAVPSKTFFKEFEEHGSRLMQWWHVINKVQFDAFLQKYLDRDEDAIIEVMRAIVPTGISGGGAFKSDVNKDVYDHIRYYLDPEKVIELLRKKYSEKDLDQEPYWDHWLESKKKGLDENLNMARQFVHVHGKNSSEQEKST